MTAPHRRLALSVACALAALAGCASTPPPRAAVAAPSHSTARLAVAHVTAASGSLVSGSLRLVPAGDGVRVTGMLGGLTPGSRHGLHVHVAGDCGAADASAAGDVFTAMVSTPSGARQAGNNTTIVAGGDGVAHVDLRLAHASLGGGAADDIAGRAIVVHALPDEALTAPQADLRLGCGVITVATP